MANFGSVISTFDKIFLDLGCGDGELLKLLKIDKNINGYGIDYDVKNIKKSLQNNIANKNNSTLFSLIQLYEQIKCQFLFFYYRATY